MHPTPFQAGKSNRGFTLVELLVVIAIIAILASVFIVSAGSVINAAKRAKANASATQIQTAILAYQTEYGLYPIVPPAGAQTDTIFTTTGQEAPMMLALCGNINPYNPTTPTAGTVPNTRNIQYLTPKRTEVDTSGVMVTPFSSGGTYYYYSVAMDSDYDGVLGDSGGAAPPNFVGWTQGSAQPAAVNISQPTAIWACCDPKNLSTPNTSTAPNLWIHTY